MVNNITSRKRGISPFFFDKMKNDGVIENHIMKITNFYDLAINS